MRRKQDSSKTKVSKIQKDSNLKKRNASLAGLNEIQYDRKKRAKHCDEGVKSSRVVSIGETLISNFISIKDQEIKDEMVKAVDQFLLSRKDLFNRVIE